VEEVKGRWAPGRAIPGVQRLDAVTRPREEGVVAVHMFTWGVAQVAEQGEGEV
jgi:hypothetical protein